MSCLIGSRLDRLATEENNFRIFFFFKKKLFSKDMTEYLEQDSLFHLIESPLNTLVTKGNSFLECFLMK